MATLARKTVFGWGADVCRALGRKSLLLPSIFDRMADWCLERAR